MFHWFIDSLGSSLAEPSGLPDRRAGAVWPITRAMVAHSQMMSGTGRLCASLVTGLGERLFCKTGGEAVFGMGLPALGWGVGIKIEDGNSRGMSAAVVEACSSSAF